MSILMNTTEHGNGPSFMKQQHAMSWSTPLQWSMLHGDDQGSWLITGMAACNDDEPGCRAMSWAEHRKASCRMRSTASRNCSRPAPGTEVPHSWAIRYNYRIGVLLMLIEVAELRMVGAIGRGRCQCGQRRRQTRRRHRQMRRL